MSDSVETFWQNYVNTLPDDEKPDSYMAWGFGDSPEMANELGALVLEGKKTGTASLAWEYDIDGEALPRTGEHSVILDGEEEPLCIIKTTRVYIEPYNLVDDEQAYAEGEGDRTLDYWRKEHWNYFSRRCQAIGREPSEYMPVVCERFQVVWSEAIQNARSL